MAIPKTKRPKKPSDNAVTPEQILSSMASDAQMIAHEVERALQEHGEYSHKNFRAAIRDWLGDNYCHKFKTDKELDNAIKTTMRGI